MKTGQDYPTAQFRAPDERGHLGLHSLQVQSLYVVSQCGLLATPNLPPFLPSHLRTYLATVSISLSTVPAFAYLSVYPLAYLHLCLLTYGVLNYGVRAHESK
jgi:hypothetical protein